MPGGGRNADPTSVPPIGPVGLPPSRPIAVPAKEPNASRISPHNVKRCFTCMSTSSQSIPPHRKPQRSLVTCIATHSESSSTRARTARPIPYFTIKTKLCYDRFGQCYAATGFWVVDRSEEHTSELQSLMRISYAVFCLKKKKKQPLHH